MKIVVLLGSIRIGRHTHKAAEYLCWCLNEHPSITQVDLWDLASHPLPMMETPINPNVELENASNKLSQLLTQADGIVLVSPEYHGSYTGVLKNALDYLGTEFKRKPVGVAVTGSGKMGGINASVQMQHLVLSMGCFAMPQKLLVPFVDTAFDDNGQPKENTLKNSFDKFVTEMIWLTEAITNQKNNQQ